MMPSAGGDVALWIVATPIGTLGDLSPRARRILADADVIAAEDTRTTRKLLGAMDVAAPELVALHAHNERDRAVTLADRAVHDTVVLVSDAGTPGISDPGRLLVEAAHAREVEIRSVPGPSALAAALAASGLPAAPSTFLGFAPRKGRDGFVREALGRPETLVVYEAPGRVADLVARLAALAPAREAVVARELSKRFEEVVRGPLAELASRLAEGRTRGEYVVVIGPGATVDAATDTALHGDGLKDVAAALAARWGCSRRDAYQALLRLQGELREG